MAFQIVNDNLNKPTLSNPQKTIAHALMDGSITLEDLSSINTAFPANDRNWRGLNDGPYSSAEAMMQFTRAVVPHLSDRQLYDITHKLVFIETRGNNTQAFRTSTLAKCFVIAELERHRLTTPQGQLPATFLSHMKSYVLPLCEHLWPGKIEANVNTFVDFNMSANLMTPEAVTQFKHQDFYPQIKNFPDNFNSASLSAAPKGDPQKFLAEQALTMPVSIGQQISAFISSFSSFMQSTSQEPKISQPKLFKEVTADEIAGFSSTSLSMLDDLLNKKQELADQVATYKKMLEEVNKQLMDNPDMASKDSEAYDGIVKFIGQIQDRLHVVHVQKDKLEEMYKSLAEKISPSNRKPS